MNGYDLKIERGDGSFKIQTGNRAYDDLYERTKALMLNDRLGLFFAGKAVQGYRSPDSRLLWLRDHTHQMKAFKYWEWDMKSGIDAFLLNQRDDGSFWDYIGYSRNGTLDCRRIGCEADLEYLAVEAAYTVWQVTGDDEWIERRLPILERGLQYCMESPLRWSREYGLIKRPFTIDTWDFEWTGKPGLERTEPDEESRFCIMHGDNSGFYMACRLLAKLFRRFDRLKAADKWDEIAQGIKKRMNEVCWNGRFYTHQVHIDPVGDLGVDESEQLSLSNTYDMNRGVADPWQCESIIREYMKRRESRSSFAEWFSIDPPFPDGVFYGWAYRAGEYVNGGVMPFVGGELGKAAFNNGFEKYGADILTRYYEMISEKNQAYLWYHRDGRPGISSADNPGEYGDTLPTDGWGSSAMLSALIEGLAGVVDNGCCYDDIVLSPKWHMVGERKALVRVGYRERGDVEYHYEYSPDERCVRIDFKSNAKAVLFRLPVPENVRISCVTVNDEPVEWTEDVVGLRKNCVLKLFISSGSLKVFGKEFFGE